MYKYILAAGCGLLAVLDLSGQPNNIARVLHAVEQNNPRLKAYQRLIDGKQLEFKSRNNLPDPRVSGYLLPFAGHTSANYREFEISQSLEFPSVYGTRSNLIEQKGERLQTQYAQKRQEILLNAKNYCLDIIYLHKRLVREQDRVAQAETVFEHVQTLYDSDQIGILAMNKAKVAWMQDQFAVEQIKNKIKNKRIALQKLNGNNPVEISLDEYPGDIDLASFDSLWLEKRQEDPALTILEENEAIALKNIKLQKRQGLPDISAGFNFQGIPGQDFSGIYGGISIPLFSNKYKVNTARVQHDYRQSQSEATRNTFHGKYQQQYNRYEMLLNKYQEYQSTLEGLNSEQLLFEAYEAEEFSFREYYMELQFYRQAYNKMLEVEKLLNILKAKLLKHRL